MPKEVLYELALTNKKPDHSKIKVDGDILKWNQFLSLRDKINPDFNIVTPVDK
jgi:alkyl sulfatase BDS1-like metallo-beta-lactamase superfamily hydrolase